MKKLLNVIIILSTLLIGTASVVAEMVLYNTKTRKFHKLDCEWAKQCTVNCIKIDRKEAIKRGGVSCKICGG